MESNYPRSATPAKLVDEESSQRKLPGLETSQSSHVNSIGAFPVHNPSHSNRTPQCQTQGQNPSKCISYRPGMSKQPFFLQGASERQFGAEPIYPSYPIPPFVSPEGLGAPPTSPTITAFGQSPTSMISSSGSFGQQMDDMLARSRAQQHEEDVATKQMWKQYDGLIATKASESSAVQASTSHDEQDYQG